MPESLNGKTIAIIATDGVEQAELTEPRKAVEQAGATVELLSLETGEIQAMNSDIEPADTFAVDKRVADVSQADYDGLILPGGTVNADKLRASDDVVGFVKAYFATCLDAGGIQPITVSALHGSLDALDAGGLEDAGGRRRNVARGSRTRARRPRGRARGVALDGRELDA